MSSRFRLWLASIFAGAFAIKSIACAETPTRVFDFQEYLLAPVRVHLLTAEDQHALSTTLKEEDIERITRKANRIWSQAGIGFFIESIVREKPAEAEVPDANLTNSYRWLLSYIPPASYRTDLFNIYYIKEFGVNGIYFPKAIFVKDTAALRRVEGGIDEPLPRVTSHELGHALGLPHRQDTFNLMASGTTGTLLNEAEIENARSGAVSSNKFIRASELLDQADALLRMGKESEARELYRQLSALPLEGEPMTRIREQLQSQSPAETR